MPHRYAFMAAVRDLSPCLNPRRKSPAPEALLRIVAATLLQLLLLVSSPIHNSPIMSLSLPCKNPSLCLRKLTLSTPRLIKLTESEPRSTIIFFSPTTSALTILASVSFPIARYKLSPLHQLQLPLLLLHQIYHLPRVRISPYSVYHISQ